MAKYVTKGALVRVLQIREPSREDKRLLMGMRTCEKE
jgi:hypothetical protein